ncbi:hypothetical protein ACA910_008152 [Epithemia clementina (nom. ined.)]
MASIVIVSVAKLHHSRLAATAVGSRSFSNATLRSTATSSSTSSSSFRASSAGSRSATLRFTRFGHQSRRQEQHQKRSFFRFARDHHHKNNYHHHRQYNNRFFENQDPGLRWTATLSDPAPVAGPEDIPSRAEQLERLQNQDEEYDVLVIGGGATGAGIALDAAVRGLKVACIERGDFGSETSSRSTKLIWAGIKYMGTAIAALLNPYRVWERGVISSVKDFVGEITMVYHCHVERHYMATQNKHLCHWIPIAVPFPAWVMDPPPFNFPLFAIFPMVAPVVFKIYDGLSGFTCPPSYVMRPSTVEKIFPQLDTSKIRYCAVFYEAQHNDARTNLAIALTAAQKGAHICNYVAAVELTKDEETSKVTGATAVDRMTNNVFQIKAKKVVFAGGPFTDNLRKMELFESSGDNNNNNNEPEKLKPAVGGAHGSHVVLPGRLMPQGTDSATGKPMGLLDICTSDNRFLFILPWLGHTLAGTTDKRGVAETLPLAPQDDVDWLLNESSKYWKPELKPLFSRKEVMSSWRGWRPLAADPHAPPGAPVSRDHVISEHPETGVLFIAGGKWTTWREMAEDVVDRLTTKRCTTLKIPLWGAKGYSDSLVDDVQAKYKNLDRDICEHLVSTYGGSVWEVCSIFANNHKNGLDRRLVDGYPYIEAEVIYACREYACSVEDILSRRTRLAYLNYDAALAALPRVAQLMQKELKWSRGVTQKQIEAAKGYMESYGGHHHAGTPETAGVGSTIANDDDKKTKP